jgi:hypothetical protein
MQTLSFARVSSPAGSWTPTKNPPPRDYSCDEDFFQVTGRADGGAVYVYDKGLTPQNTIPLHWPNMRVSDFNSLKTFYETMKGRRYSFTFIDPNGGTSTVRFWSKLSWVWVSSALLDVSFLIIKDGS